MRKRMASLVSMVLIAGTLSACGDTPNADARHEARATAAGYLTALGERDYRRACELMTKPGRLEMQRSGSNYDVRGSCAAVLEVVAEGQYTDEEEAALAAIDDGDLGLEREGDRFYVSVGRALFGVVMNESGEWRYVPAGFAASTSTAS